MQLGIVQQDGNQMNSGKPTDKSKILNKNPHHQSVNDSHSHEQNSLISRHGDRLPSISNNRSSGALQTANPNPAQGTTMVRLKDESINPNPPRGKRKDSIASSSAKPNYPKLLKYLMLQNPMYQPKEERVTGEKPQEYLPFTWGNVCSWTTGWNRLCGVKDVDSDMDSFGSAMTFYFRFIKCSILYLVLSAIVATFLSIIYYTSYSAARIEEPDSLTQNNALFRLRDYSNAVSLGGFVYNKNLLLEANFTSATQLNSTLNTLESNDPNIFKLTCSEGSISVDPIYSIYGLSKLEAYLSSKRGSQQLYELSNRDKVQQQ